MYIYTRQPSGRDARDLEREYFATKDDRRGDNRRDERKDDRQDDRQDDRKDYLKEVGGAGSLGGRLDLGARKTRFEPYSRPRERDMEDSRPRERDMEGSWKSRGGMRMDDFENRKRHGGGGGGGGGMWGRVSGRRDGGGGGGRREARDRKEPLKTNDDLDKAMDSYWNSVSSPPATCTISTPTLFPLPHNLRTSQSIGHRNCLNWQTGPDF